MANGMRGMRLGAGLLGLGYGVYRLTRGKRDWMTTTALTAGLSFAVTGMSAKRRQQMMPRIRSLASTVGKSLPRFQRTMMRMTPPMVSKAGAALINALR